ncbi:MAG: DUF4389 domain-containing protein [Mariprofundales bacterium]
MSDKPDKKELEIQETQKTQEHQEVQEKPVDNQEDCQNDRAECQSSHKQYQQQMKKHICRCSTWIRLLYMLLLTVFYTIAEIVLTAIIVFQFLCVLFTGEVNERLAEFGEQLSCYIYAILRYLNYNSEERPFPFSDWPSVSSSTDTNETSNS